MNILIIGSGGREHAIAWKTAQSSIVDKIYVAPGNGGTALEHKVENRVENIAIDPLDFSKLIEFAKAHQVALTLVGPEAPLAAGIVDAFKKEDLACFGPNKNAAKLESSKQFSKEFMVQHQIPTAAFGTFTEITSAKNYVAEHYRRHPSSCIVIKADGLAAGKGVVIAANMTEAFTAIDEMLESHRFGEAGHRVIIEEFLEGEEVSYIVVTDGENFIPLATSQDHKARDEGDKGPNTGGMGAYSPAPIVSRNPQLETRIINEVIKPTIQGLRDAGTPYIGFLYAGLMITPDGEPKVLEFNCRLGDPEAEIILLRLQSDLIELCQHTLAGTLNEYHIDWDPRSALGVILASKGYPGPYEKGLTISGLEKINDLINSTKANAIAHYIKVFHAGTQLTNNKLITNGGRVLCISALGDSLEEAQTRVYQHIDKINWPGMFYRKDIGPLQLTTNN